MISILVLGVSTYILVGLLQPLFKPEAKVNYEGNPIPTALGLSFILPSSLVLIAQGKHFLFALTFLGFGLLGLVDDFFGTNDVKGFKGHFGSSLLSTGMLKAFGALGFSLAINLNLNQSLWVTGLNILLMALSANFINLLDLRPGRAGKAFLVLSLPLVAFVGIIREPLFLIMASVFAYLPWDLRGDVMMGDIGSNSLGAVLGLGLALGLPSLGKVLLVVILLFLNLASERFSFSRIIEENPVLNFLDRLGR